MTHTTEINIKWSADDVLMMDDSLSPEQVGKVLDLMERSHDACYGINWDSITEAINTIKEGEGS